MDASRRRALLAYGLLWISTPALPAADSIFRRGDVNQDGQLDLSDPVKVFNVLFLGDPSPGCDDALDLNDDGALDISDGIYGLAFLFTDGSQPRDPFPDCG